MRLEGATALVTGANRGFGHHLTEELRRRGAKVYAASRRPGRTAVPGTEVLELDITDRDAIARVARVATDVDVLINNAAHTGSAGLLRSNRDEVRQMIDTHFYGTLDMIRAFAPLLGANGGGAILNVLSPVAWTSIEANTALAAAKSAQWGLTNGVRLELADQGTQVTALVAGLIGTDTLREAMRGGGLPFPAEAVNEPADLARRALDGLEAGQVEILDPLSRAAKAALARSAPPVDLTSLAHR